MVAEAAGCPARAKRAVGCVLVALLVACAAPRVDSGAEPLWVQLRTIELRGADPADLGPILASRILVSETAGGLVGPRQGLPSFPMKVGDLTSGEERRVGASLLQFLVESIAAYYARENRMGTKVDITRSALDRMLAGGTTLVIRVRAPQRP